MNSADTYVSPQPEQSQGGSALDGAPGVWQFILDYPRPPKGLHANDRAHYMVRAGAVADIRLEVMAKVRALHIGVLERVSVQVVWVVATKATRDEDGPDPFCKAIYDGIGSSSRGYSAHLVEDDSPEFMVKPRLTIRYEQGVHPHFEVNLTDLGGVS